MRTRTKETIKRDIQTIGKRFDKEHYYLGAYMIFEMPIEVAEAVKVSQSLEPALIWVEGLASAPITRIINTPKTIYTFGVEIECYIDRFVLIDTLRTKGYSIENERYTHDAVRNDFKIVDDGSVRGRRNNLEGSEVVSNVMKTDNFTQLEAVCDALNDQEAEVSVKCGLHVHIGTQNMTAKQVCNTFINYLYLEPIIDKSLAPSRRNNSFCETLAGYGYSLISLANQIEQNAWSVEYVVRRIQEIVNYDRYLKINAMAYDRHKTIEFRQHQGSTNYEKIRNWVEFLTSLCDWSKDHVLDNAITEKNDPRLEGLAVDKLSVSA